MSHYIYINTVNRMADQDFSDSFESFDIRKGDVRIGDYCWIGAYVFVVEGASIGENSVIGAHSVVTKDLPPHSICTGAPAKVIKFKSYLGEEEKRDLAESYRERLSDDLRDELLS